VNSRAILPGVQGAVGLANDLWRGHVLTVDGVRAKSEGGFYLLPGTDGQPVKAKLKGRYFTDQSVLTIGDASYATGEPSPPFLFIIAFLPVLFLFGGNPFAVALAAVGVFVNFWVIRAQRAEAWKSMTILGLFVGGVLLMAIWAFVSSWVMSLLPH